MKFIDTNVLVYLADKHDVDKREIAKAGGAVVAPKQEGAQGLYKVWAVRAASKRVIPPPGAV